MRPTEPLGSVALRHVVEDAILLIRGTKQLAPSRRKSVLTDLEILFDEAYKGSELSHRGSLFVAPTEKTAFEAFSLFNRHISLTESESRGELSYESVIWRAISMRGLRYGSCQRRWQ